MEATRQDAPAITLVGVIHRDPAGHAALLQLLEALGPEAVTVEFSPLGLRWREEKGGILLQRLERLARNLPPERRTHHRIRLIRETLRIPFEFSAAETYARESNIPLHPVDLNRISREHLPWYEFEVLNQGNLVAVTGEKDRDLQEVVRAARRRASRCLRGEISLLEAGVRADWDRPPGLGRERFLACRVRKLAARHRKVVHVGGWIHLVEDGEGRSLASLLGDLSPRKVLLGEPRPAPL